mgnify:FL=1
MPKFAARFFRDGIRSKSIYMNKVREILKIGVPIMLGQACVIILAFADNIMIGWHSVNELAASSFVNNVMNFFILTELGFASGMTPIIGAFHGNGNVKGVGTTVRNGLLVNGIIGLIGLILLAVIYLFIDSFGQEPELLPLIRPYFVIVGISIIFALGFNVLKQFTDGICKPVVSMLFLMGGNVLNIFGNWVLIYGKLGCPELGLMGAGLSTLISRILMLLCFVLYIFKSEQFKVYAQAIKEALFSRVKMRHIFNMGYPVAIQMGLEASTFSFSAIMVGWISVTALAAHQVAITISQLFFLMMQGLSFALSILVSNCYGKKDYAGIHAYVKRGILMIFGTSLSLSILLYIFRYPAVGMFTDSPEVAEIAVVLFYVLFAYQIGDGIQLCFANVLRGLQDVKPIMYAAFVSYYLIAIPVAYVLGFKAGLGAVGVWLGFPIGLTLAGLFFYARYRSDMRRLTAE